MGRAERPPRQCACAHLPLIWSSPSQRLWVDVRLHLSLVMENPQWAYAADWHGTLTLVHGVWLWSEVLQYCCSFLFVCPFSLLCRPLRVGHVINQSINHINHSTRAAVKLNRHSVRFSMLGSSHCEHYYVIWPFTIVKVSKAMRLESSLWVYWSYGTLGCNCTTPSSYQLHGSNVLWIDHVCINIRVVCKLSTVQSGVWYNSWNKFWFQLFCCDTCFQWHGVCWTPPSSWYMQRVNGCKSKSWCQCCDKWWTSKCNGMCKFQIATDGNLGLT